MGQPAAKQGDQITAIDTHIVINPSGVATPLPHPFSGVIDGSLSSNVMIMGKPAATVDSTASNLPPHIPAVGTFKSPPANQGRIITGSATVRINGKMAARIGDTAMTCNDPAELPVGQVVAVGTVLIGG